MRKFIVVVLLCVIMALGFFATVEAVGGKLTMDTIDRAENVCSLGDCLYCGGAGEPQTGYWICIQSLRRFQDFWSKLPWVPDYYNYDMTIMLVDRTLCRSPFSMPRCRPRRLLAVTLCPCLAMVSLRVISCG